MDKIRYSRIFTAIIAATFFSSFSNLAWGGAFQLNEENASGLAEIYAGGAAIADDASTEFYNPAGLVMISHPEIVASGVGIWTNPVFNGTTSLYNTAVPSAFTPTFFSPLVQGGTAEGNTSNFVPAFYASYPVNDRLVLAIGSNGPFGLATNWGDGSVVAFNGTLSTLNDYNVSPGFGFKINNNLSIGAGADIQYLTANLNAKAGFPLSPLFGLILPGSPFTSTSENSASGWGVGWHAGVLYQFCPATRIGFTYHSQTSFSNLTGESSFSGPLATAAGVSSAEIESNNLQTSIKLPPFMTLSGYHDMNDIWAVMASIGWTEWSVDQKIVLHNVAGTNVAFPVPLPLPISTPTTNLTATIPLDWKNTFNGEIGTQVKLTQKLMLKLGVGASQTPTVESARTIRLPDSNYYDVAAGFHYQFINNLGGDLGYAHVFYAKSSLSAPTVVGSEVATENGSVTNSVNLVGAQITFDFC